jgi:fatty-acyl-CoA synthase
MNIAWWVERWSELHPDKPAILFEGEQIRYFELHQRVNQTSCWLQSLGIGKGDRVAVMLNNCPEFIELYLACSRLGAIFVPVNFRLAGPELEYTLKNSSPSLFVFGNEYADDISKLNLSNFLPLMQLATVGKQSGLSGTLNYASETAAFQDQKPAFAGSPGPTDPEEPHVIMYTSGTTGQAQRRSIVSLQDLF